MEKWEPKVEVGRELLPPCASCPRKFRITENACGFRRVILESNDSSWQKKIHFHDLCGYTNRPNRRDFCVRLFFYHLWDLVQENSEIGDFHRRAVIGVDGWVTRAPRRPYRIRGYFMDLMSQKKSPIDQPTMYVRESCPRKFALYFLDKNNGAKIRNETLGPKLDLWSKIAQDVLWSTYICPRFCGRLIHTSSIHGAFSICLI